MKKTKLLLVAAAVLSLVSSCIVSDQLDTLTIHPDGSADWVRFQSNIRSTEKGEKGAEQLKRFVEDFDEGKDPELARIRESGGQILEARFVRREEPCATVVRARLPGAGALQAFCTLKEDRGEALVEARFGQDGKRRRLALAIRLPKDHPFLAAGTPERDQLRRGEADGISESRVAVTRGEITGSRGFTVASDKRSALLDLSEVRELAQAGGGQVESFLEWEVAGN